MVPNTAVDTSFSQIWPLSLLNVAAASYELTISSSRLLTFSYPIHRKSSSGILSFLTALTQQHLPSKPATPKTDTRHERLHRIRQPQHRCRPLKSPRRAPISPQISENRQVIQLAENNKQTQHRPPVRHNPVPPARRLCVSSSENDAVQVLEKKALFVPSAGRCGAVRCGRSLRWLRRPLLLHLHPPPWPSLRPPSQ